MKGYNGRLLWTWWWSVWFHEGREISWVVERILLAFEEHVTARAILFELFESDGSRWLCNNLNARTERIMYEHVGKKKKNSLLCGIGERFYWLICEVWSCGKWPFRKFCARGSFLLNWTLQGNKVFVIGIISSEVSNKILAGKWEVILVSCIFRTRKCRMQHGYPNSSMSVTGDS
jgi:hypothetical protein